MRHNKQKYLTTNGRIRIIAGQFRGRQVPVLDAPGLRPTTDRTKETLFNWLMQDVQDAVCLDGFAGSGSLGFEALSRGAKHVYFVEKIPQAAQQITRNAEQLGCAQQASIINNEFEQALKQIKREFGDIPVLVRTQDDYHLEQFQIYGAAEVVPEALEGSLMLVSHVLTLLEVPADVIKERIHTVRSQRYRLLHGFVHGGQSLKADLDQSRVIQKHAVTLSENAHACGKNLDELDLELEVSSLIQNGEEIDNPSGAVCLYEGDTLILKGSPREIEQAEERILLGNL